MLSSFIMIDSVPKIAVTHGQAVWALWHLFDGASMPDQAFNSYVKYLRRAGIPFDSRELGVGAGTNVVYVYEHLMDLAVALFLKSQAILRKDVVEVLAHHRDELRSVYRLAWTERETELGKPVWVRIGVKDKFRLRGVYLDLGLRYVEEGLLTTTGPKALGPAAYIRAAGTQHRRQYFRDPIPLSELAIDIVKLAKAAPEIKRGRR